MTSPVFWLCLILVPVATLIPDLLYKTTARTLFPSLQDEYCEMERLMGASLFEEEAPPQMPMEETKPPPPPPSSEPPSQSSSAPTLLQDPSQETTEGDQDASHAKKKAARRKKKPGAPGRRVSKRLSTTSKGRSSLKLTPTEREALLFAAQLERAQAGPKVFVFCPIKGTLEERKLATLRHDVDDVESTSYNGGVNPNWFAVKQMLAKSQASIRPQPPPQQQRPSESAMSKIWKGLYKYVVAVEPPEEDDGPEQRPSCDKTTSTVDLEGNKMDEEEDDSSESDGTTSSGGSKKAKSTTSVSSGERGPRQDDDVVA